MADRPGPPREVAEAIRRTCRPLIVGHVRPDADCLGAMGALALSLGQNGRCEPRLYYRADQVSGRLAFLAALAQFPVAPPEQCRSCDAVIVLDTAQSSRAAADPPLPELAAAGLPVINIDHHVDNPGFGTVNWVVPTAGSTSELVYDLLTSMRMPILPAVASLLYAGIHADTVGFSLPNTTAETLRTAAALVAAGADVGELCERLCRSQSRGEFNLARIIYDNTRLTTDGLIAYSTASHEEIIGAGCGPADIDEQVAIPRSLKGIRMAILFTEGRPGRVRINFRGEGGTDVLELARELGGGGHTTSAGAIVNGSLPQVVPDVLERAARRLRS